MMLELKGEYYYNNITINNLVTDEILEGEIFINNDGWCEGIINNGSNQNLIIGIFNKYENLELYEITKNSTYKYSAIKAYLQYDGAFERLNDSDIEIPFNIKCSQLMGDPRENLNNNASGFLLYLSVLKKELFKDKQIKDKYDYILNSKEKIKERLSEFKSKKYKMVI